MIDIWGAAAIAAKFALYLGVLISAGTVFAALIFGISHLRRTAVSWAAVGLLAALAGFLLSAAALTGDASGMSDWSILSLLWSTPVGTALALRGVGLVLLILGSFFGGTGLWVSAVGACLALWSFATVGHVPDRDAFWITGLLFLHLTAVSIWIGILHPLKRLCAIETAQAAAELGHRFGRVASVFVPVLLLAGIIMSVQLVGSWSALLGTDYGQVLAVKVLCVAMLLSLAALNKLRIVPHIRAGQSGAVSQLSRAIGFEWAAMIAILLLTAIFTSVLTLPN